MRGLASEGVRYQGCLYIGLILTASGPMVLEFSCRLGDPETQAIVARMDFDLAQALSDLAAGTLEPSQLKWKPGASVCVVIASEGYPGKYAVGKKIDGLTDVRRISGVEVFHAGTQRQRDSIIATGGRAFALTPPGAALD